MDMINYFINGGLSGFVGIIISHPFDTIKTNIQNGKDYKLLFKNNKIQFKDLYRGILPPLLGVGFEKCIVFGIYKNIFNYLKNKDINDFYNNLISGGLAGFSASFIVTPFEKIKIQLQTNTFVSTKNLFNGLNATFTREVPGFAIYFSTYNYLKSNKKLSFYQSFIYGGLSGGFAWFFIYPQDMIKSQIQVQNENKQIYQIIKQIYYKNGLFGFYKGFHLSLLRSIPLHAGVFMTNELLSNTVL